MSLFSKIPLKISEYIELFQASVNLPFVFTDIKIYVQQISVFGLMFIVIYLLSDFDKKQKSGAASTFWRTGYDSSVRSDYLTFWKKTNVFSHIIIKL